MNVIFVLIVLSAFCFTGWQQIFFVSVPGSPSPMEILSKAMITSAGGAVELAIGLVGVMALFLGLMKVAEARCTDGSSGHGCHDSEPFGQHVGAGQCRYTLWHPGHAGA
jgi:hypothetical protein